MLPPDDLYPTELTQCADEPKVPARPAPGAPRDPTSVSYYIGDLRNAWADCHDDVAAIKDRKDRYSEQYQDQQRSPVERGLRRLWPFGNKKD